MEKRKSIRIRLQLDPEDWHGALTEGVWARLVQPLGDPSDVKAIMQVENIPFYSRAVSFGDIVLVDFNSGVPMLESVIERSGHSTCRLFAEEPGIEVSRAIEQLKAMGCGWESATINGGKLYAIDVPPEVDLDDVHELLGKGQEQGLWLFETGQIGHPPSDAPDPIVS